MDIKKIREAKKAIERLNLTEMMINSISGEKKGGFDMGHGQTAYSDITGETAMQMDELKKRLADDKEDMERLCKIAMDELDLLDDPVTKQIIILREWYGMRWARVARKVGCSHTESSVRQKYCRVIKETS